jgi:predicted esterase
MKNFIFFLFLFQVTVSKSQNYIDTVFSIQTVQNIEYGIDTNFAGQAVSLKMDISYPTNDSLSECGRPLIILIHGGAWLAGSKNESFIPSLRTDFAKRGYVAAAINYRLGFFQTDTSKNCNVPNWNCMNAADEAEWSRALYRGIQDAKAAIRYLIINQNDYDIDPANVFVVGESAGAFIALGVGYMDHELEKPTDCYAIPAAAAPHQNYYTPCIQNSSFSIPIQNMNLERPDLGPVEGNLNPSNLPYSIKAVGAFYGGIYQELFSQKAYTNTPQLYMFHQPNDLIVPMGYNKILQGFNDCAAATGCVNIQQRKLAYGSAAIDNLIDTLMIPASHKPNVLFETNNNNADCLQQVLNPALGGHQLDNYRNRTNNLSTFFAPNIDSDACLTLSNGLTENDKKVIIFPNPTTNIVHVKLREPAQINLYSIDGKLLKTYQTNSSTLQIDLSALKNGIYLIQIISSDFISTDKIIKY